MKQIVKSKIKNLLTNKFEEIRQNLSVRTLPSELIDQVNLEGLSEEEKVITRQLAKLKPKLKYENKQQIV